jgi:hypothetical protein
MRRLVWIIVIGFVFIALLWSGGWFALASWVEARVPRVLEQFSDQGLDVDCEGRDVVGFPFAIQVSCGETAVAERRTGSQAELGGVTGGASIFAPLTAEIALDSPARIESPVLPGSVDVQWEEAALHVGMGVNGPQTLSFDATDLSADLPIPEVPGARIAAGSAGGTLAPSGNGGTDATITFSGLLLADTETTLPPLDGRVSGWISAPPRALLAGRAGLQAPLSARLTDTAIVTGGSRIEAEGNVTVDAEGIVDGTITVRLAGAEGLQALIAALPVEHQENGNKAIGGLFLFGTPITLNGEPASELTVEIVRGVTKVGPVEVTLPRVPL